MRVRIVRGGKSADTTALVNSGFETDERDIVVPVGVAEELGLWPPHGASTAILDTGGGETATPYYRSCATLELVLKDRELKPLEVNVIVNPHVDEVVISDYVASELGIVLLDLKRGLWRLADDAPDRVRESAARG